MLNFLHFDSQSVHPALWLGKFLSRILSDFHATVLLVGLLDRGSSFFSTVDVVKNDRFRGRHFFSRHEMLAETSVFSPKPAKPVPRIPRISRE